MAKPGQGGRLTRSCLSSERTPRGCAGHSPSGEEGNALACVSLNPAGVSITRVASCTGPGLSSAPHLHPQPPPTPPGPLGGWALEWGERDCTATPTPRMGLAPALSTLFLVPSEAGVWSASTLPFKPQLRSKALALPDAPPPPDSSRVFSAPKPCFQRQPLPELREGVTASHPGPRGSGGRSAGEWEAAAARGSSGRREASRLRRRGGRAGPARDAGGAHTRTSRAPPASAGRQARLRPPGAEGVVGAQGTRPH